MLGRRKETQIEVSPDSTKFLSIRGQILRRILPVVLLPLLGLGVLAIVGVAFIQQRTSTAVSDAETILTDQVVADGANRSAETAAREVAEFVDALVLRSTRANEQASFRESVVEASNAGEDDVSRIQVLALTVRDDLTVDEDDIQVLIVGERGNRLGSTDDINTLVDNAEQQWFVRAIADGVAWRSFVDDGEHVPSFELALRTRPPATTQGAGVLRIRVPLSNVQGILDQVADDNAVSAAMIDTSASLILADTATGHDADIVFDTSTMMSPTSGVNLELLRPGTVQTDDTISSARRVVDSMENDQDVTFNWLVQTNQSVDVAGASLEGIREVSEDVNSQRQLITLGVLGLLALALLFAFLAVRAVANRITAPVKALSDQAQEAATDGIPAVVEAARTSEQLPELPDFEVETNDELAVLAHSLNTMQDAAVDLAAGQAKLRRQNVARTFVSLGRRNQNLLNRQLEFIEELEEQETDADALENLFRLDHLATRMRRNAENLLVLAGEQTPRRWGRPIAVRDVLRAAASEIADYRRVKLGDVDPATVSGNLATDLSHLIAELLENAGSFSPPNTPIEVLGQHTSTHYRLAIVDHGIGMDPAALEEVNGRLRNPVDFADAPSAYLGLFVVGRLAQDIGITVRLASADPTGEGRRRGTIAFVDLPVSVLSTEEATPIEIDERNAEAMARRAEQDVATQAAAPAIAPTPPEPEVVVPPIPAAEPSAPVGTTAAGFPQRRRGGAAAATPQPVAEATPVAEPPVEEAPAAPAAPATETAPIAPVTEITAAGFPKRRGSGASAPSQPTPAPAEQPSGAPIEVPQRDATAVSSSLRSFRAAVARGRATGQAEVEGTSEASDDVPTAPTPPIPAPAPAAEAPAPAAPAPIPDLAKPVPTPTPGVAAPVAQPAPVAPTAPQPAAPQPFAQPEAETAPVAPTPPVEPAAPAPNPFAGLSQPTPEAPATPAPVSPTPAPAQPGPFPVTPPTPPADAALPPIAQEPAAPVAEAPAPQPTAPRTVADSPVYTPPPAYTPPPVPQGQPSASMPAPGVQSAVPAAPATPATPETIPPVSIHEADEAVIHHSQEPGAENPAPSTTTTGSES